MSVKLSFASVHHPIIQAFSPKEDVLVQTAAERIKNRELRYIDHIFAIAKLSDLDCVTFFGKIRDVFQKESKDFIFSTNCIRKITSLQKSLLARVYKLRPISL